MNGWMPIETAPNEGRVRLTDGKAEAVGLWSLIEDWTNPDTGELCEDYDWLTEEGDGLGFIPTHWMPLTAGAKP